jgi:hypothetical protein
LASSPHASTRCGGFWFRHSFEEQPMAQADWLRVVGSAPTQLESPGNGQVNAGATRGLGDVPGGLPSFVIRAAGTAPATRAMRLDQVDFSPTDRGGAVSVAACRLTDNADVFAFVGLAADDVEAPGYALGLSRGGHVVLRKGPLVLGVPDEEPGGAAGVLRRSVATVVTGAWAHLRLVAIVQLNGDVLLRVQRSDLAQHPVDAPAWEPVPGMDVFIDDLAGVNSGSLPLGGGGFLGWGGRVLGAGAAVALTAASATRQ